MGHRLRGSYCVFILCLSAATEIRADEAFWKLYVDRFQVYRRKGEFAEAEKAALAAIAEAEKSGAESEVAASRNNLGALYYDTGRYADAEKQFLCALGRSDNQVPDPEVMNSLGLVYLKTGRLKEAETLLLQVWNSREKASSPEQVEIAESLNSLAELYRMQDRYSDAESNQRRALAIWDKALGPDNPKTAIGLNNLGTMLTIQGRYPEAEALYRKALDMNEKKIGCILPLRGPPTGGEKALNGAPQNRKEKPPENHHPSPGSTLCNLAELS